MAAASLSMQPVRQHQPTALCSRSQPCLTSWYCPMTRIAAAVSHLIQERQGVSLKHVTRETLQSMGALLRHFSRGGQHHSALDCSSGRSGHSIFWSATNMARQDCMGYERHGAVHADWRKVHTSPMLHRHTRMSFTGCDWGVSSSSSNSGGGVHRESIVEAPFGRQRPLD